ncbi:MAG: hypothetical protein JWP72_306 [Massilia sp.]|nr:hypothetical protein [Massilia sp.]MDB5790770.1 hypothetical protein [Massilia sp.]
MDKAEPDVQGCRRSLKSCAIPVAAPATELPGTYRANRMRPDHKNRVADGIRAVTDRVGDELADMGHNGLATCESKRAAPDAAGHA